MARHSFKLEVICTLIFILNQREDPPGIIFSLNLGLSDHSSVDFTGLSGFLQVTLRYLSKLGVLYNFILEKKLWEHVSSLNLGPQKLISTIKKGVMFFSWNRIWRWFFSLTARFGTLNDFVNSVNTAKREGKHFFTSIICLVIYQTLYFSSLIKNNT